MKKFVILLLVITFISCKSKQPATNQPTTENNEVVRFEKIETKDMDEFKKNRAFDLGKRLLETCNTSVFKVFTKNEATDKVIKNATVEKISKTCHIINHRNGKFIDLHLIEVTHDIETDDYLFRFKIEYEKTYFERELRVTINSDNKVSAMSTKELPKKPM